MLVFQMVNLENCARVSGSSTFTAFEAVRLKNLFPELNPLRLRVKAFHGEGIPTEYYTDESSDKTDEYRFCSVISALGGHGFQHRLSGREMAE